MNLRRFTRIRGQAYKVVPLPSHDMRGHLAAVDHAQRTVFIDAEVTDAQEQRAILDACQAADAVPPP